MNPEKYRDDDLLPFFNSNPELSEIYEAIGNTSDDELRKEAARKYLDCVTYVESCGEYRDDDDRKFHTDGNTFYYSEDTWTRHLFEAVTSHYSNDKVEYLAHLQGSSCN